MKKTSLVLVKNLTNSFSHTSFEAGFVPSRKFYKCLKGDNYLIPALKYTVDDYKLSHLPFIIASGRKSALIWSVIDGRGLNWMFYRMEAANTKWLFFNPTKHKAKLSWSLIWAWRSFKPVNRDWIIIFFSCCVDFITFQQRIAGIS